MKKLLFVMLLNVTIELVHAQLKSPEAFLGYTLGSRYTPHFKIVEYFKYVAAASPLQVKLEQYGETNERRPLYTAFISSQKNIASLEEIRQYNLHLAKMDNQNASSSRPPTPIVWLSYNVHGNETSSSEASMLTLFALASNNEQTRPWLENTVVVIDPCLNPDGRERYVNWFTGMMGQKANASMMSREHNEPWPGGRSNHYNYDLNRDWAWQTQVESRQRVQHYRKWMPQVHVDFHEQSVNAPYYFAPAAEPYNEVITPWQREFQKTIGTNHAKYFDQNNWLFFTNEIFDLLYPSYGDTYPLFNGAIGMTYEQGGGPAGGIAAEMNDGDTLTLISRIMHHYTTGLSTVEVASASAQKLIQSFTKYFDDAVKGDVGTYKAYVIKNNAEDRGRIASLLELLDRNGIRYTTGSGSVKGFNYTSGKEENITIGNNDIVINNNQPQAALVKVLFEPQSKLADTVTYDITAWSLPYAYGLSAYASKQAINAGQAYSAKAVNNNASSAYGYIMRWDGIGAVKAVSAMVKAGIKLRFSEMPFESNNEKFGAGSIIILKTGNEKLGNALMQKAIAIANENNMQLSPVAGGMVQKGFDFGSGSVRPLKMPKVVLLTGEGVSSTAAGEVWNYFDNEINYPITLVNANDVARIDWAATDVLIMPDGRYKLWSDKDATDNLKQWISGGGRLIALENAVSQLSKQEWSAVKMKEDDDDDSKKADSNKYNLLAKYGNRERDQLTTSTPGAVYRVEVDNTHPLMFGYPKYYYTLKMDNAVYDFIKEDGWNTGIIKKDNKVAGYVGYKLNAKLKDGLLFGVQDLGRGNIVYLADDVLFRSFWQNGKLMFGNAVFLVGQ